MSFLVTRESVSNGVIRYWRISLPYHLFQNIPQSAGESRVAIVFTAPASTPPLPAQVLNAASAILKVPAASTAMIFMMFMVPLGAS